METNRGHLASQHQTVRVKAGRGINILSYETATEIELVKLQTVNCVDDTGTISAQPTRRHTS